MRLIVKHIGPIQEIDIQLNRINVFIGPQGIGKSTISKIISFCFWIEKEVLVNQDTSFIDSKFIQEHLLNFHRINSYFDKESFLRFEGDVIHLEIHEDISIKVEKGPMYDKASIGKVGYIPAERNILSIPNINELELEENYVRSFIFDWLSIRRKYTKENPVKLLNLDIEYHFDETSGDVVKLGEDKEITLEESSSGIQSIVPLIVYIKYLTGWIYQIKEKTSYDEHQNIKLTLSREMLGDIGPKTLDIALKDPELSLIIDKLLETLPKYDFSEENPNMQKAKLLQLRISRPLHTEVIAEEPELNLFPQTQIELIYDILHEINIERDTLVITTHSPYILYAINNAMLAFLVTPVLDDEALSIKKRICFDAKIDPQSVSVWSFQNGSIMYEGNQNDTIQDKQGLIRKNYFNDIMKDVMDDFSSMLPYLDDLEDE